MDIFIFIYFLMERVQSTIVCSYNHTVCISNDKRVYSFGKPVRGVHGHNEELVFPKMISSLKNIKAVCCADSQTVCLDIEGSVFTFGLNDSGQLGVGKDKYTFYWTYEPQKLDLPPIKQISCGEKFVFCLSELGELYSFGNNSYGQLGLGNYTRSTSPQKLESFGDIELVECGYDFTLCKNIHNEIFVWGSNEYGQLGAVNTRYQPTPFKIMNVPHNIVDIKCGNYHSLVLFSTQEVYSFGDNEWGQLGRKDSPTLEKIKTLSEITRIECGGSHSMCIDVYGNLYVFGSNEKGQLGLGETDDENNTPIKHPSLSDIIDISKGGEHTFVKTSSNEIYGFGYNSGFQLGTETDDEYQLLPIQLFQGTEDMWCSCINKSNAKSARK